MFVPTPEGAASLPSYLVAAAATESRAVPTFSYQPAAGMGWAERFSLHDDPQPERTWPEHELRYADAGMQRTRERVAFTLADLAVCDPRRANDLSRIPRERWDDRFLPIALWLEGSADGRMPFVYAVDATAGLHKLVVTKHLTQLTQRCAQAWHRLRELDDLKGTRHVVERPVAAPPSEPAAVTVVAATAPVDGAVSAPASGEPSIETPRCTTCNECTNVNPRMFAYNENKQAYFKDVTAGTYRDLVEAAESCQVAIIHPGKPRDPNESGLDELLQRAEPFNS